MNAARFVKRTLTTCLPPLMLLGTGRAGQMPDFTPVPSAERIGVPAASITDVEGHVYKTVRIGSQAWMAENLRVQRTPDRRPIVSHVFGDDEERYGRYGRLYTWNVAMNGSTAAGAQGICPEGWHVPSGSDWQTLVTALGGEGAAGRKLLPGRESGFEAYPSGGADFEGRYVYFGEEAMFWSSTETAPERANHWGTSAEGRLSVFAARKAARIAVRCVQAAVVR